MGGIAGRGRRRGAGAEARLAPRAHADRRPARAVRLPQRPVALLRALAPARLSGAGDARGRGPHSAADAIPRGAAVRAAALAGLTVLVLAQPLAADVRSGQVLGREDTREQVRSFLSHRYPPELRVAIEPAVPGRYYRIDPEGRLPSWLHRCPRRTGWPLPGWSYPRPDGRRVCRRFRPGQFTRPDGGVRASAYHLVLDRGVIDEYRRHGYCLVVTFGIVRERALETGDPDVRAYYERLERESDVLRRFSPYEREPSRCRSTSTSPSTTTRRRTTAPARWPRSTGCGVPPGLRAAEGRIPRARELSRHVPGRGVAALVAGSSCARRRRRAQRSAAPPPGPQARASSRIDDGASSLSPSGTRRPREPGPGEGERRQATRRSRQR